MIYLVRCGRTHQSLLFFLLKIIFGLLADVVNITDIIVRFRIVDNHHNASHDPDIIAKGYFHGAFAWDVVASLPIYWIFIPIPWIRLNRFMKVYRVVVEAEELVQYFSVYVNMQVIRVVTFALCMILWVHMLSCLTSIIIFGDVPEEAGLWMSIHSEKFTQSWTHVYLRSTLFAWSQITNGQGDMSPQSESHLLWTLANQVRSTLSSLPPMWPFRP